MGGVGAVDGFELGVSVGWGVEGGGHVGCGSEEGARGWGRLECSSDAGGRSCIESREIHGWVGLKFRQHFVGGVRWGSSENGKCQCLWDSAGGRTKVSKHRCSPWPLSMVGSVVS